MLDNKITQRINIMTCTPPEQDQAFFMALLKCTSRAPPMRPIVTAYNTVAFNLSKFLILLLKPLTHNELTIRNSYQFKEFLKQYTLDSDHHIASFDITSLFTHIPLDETIDIICTNLSSNAQSYDDAKI